MTLLLSAIGTPTYKLAKFLVSLLSHLTVNQFSVRDSFSSAAKISSFCPNPFIASLDVESLFTNVPLNEVINICIDNLLCSTNSIHNLDRNDMRELLTLAAYKSCLNFDQVMQRRIDGVAMGSALDPFLANTFLCHFLKQWFTECTLNILPKVFKSYDDDIIVIFLYRTDLNDFVNYLDPKHPNIKFASELKKNTFSHS